MPSKIRKPLTREQKDAHNARCRRYTQELKDKAESGDPEAIEALEFKRARARAIAKATRLELLADADGGCEEALAKFGKSHADSKNRYANSSRDQKEVFNARSRLNRIREKELIEQGDVKALLRREALNSYQRQRQQKLREEILKDPALHEELKARRRDRANSKYQTSVQHRLRVLLRTRIYKALKGERKSKATIELLGCTIDEFKVHIERQFEPWMNWENQGVHVPDGPRVWHIDHIRCLNSFDLSDPKQQEEAMHFSNMRPLEGVLNLKKHAKLNYVI